MSKALLSLRAEDPESLRLAHQIKFDVNKGSLKRSAVIVGYPDDRGVALNGGRVGAKAAPDSIRSHLYGLPELRAVKIYDAGNFSFSAKASLEKDHERVRTQLNTLRSNADLLVTLGGGHDWAAADFDVPTMQVMHVDAHLDVRPPLKGGVPHSGMPFRSLAEKGIKIFALGAQSEANIERHWNYAMEKFAMLYSLGDLSSRPEHVFEKLKESINTKHPLGLSIDLDAFAQGDSPGVSAPSARGVSTAFVTLLIDAWAKHISHLGIYEVNPKFDRDGQSARLAAFFIYRLLRRKYIVT